MTRALIVQQFHLLGNTMGTGSKILIVQHKILTMARIIHWKYYLQLTQSVSYWQCRILTTTLIIHLKYNYKLTKSVWCANKTPIVSIVNSIFSVWLAPWLVFCTGIFKILEPVPIVLPKIWNCRSMSALVTMLQLLAHFDACYKRNRADKKKIKEIKKAVGQLGPKF